MEIKACVDIFMIVFINFAFTFQIEVADPKHKILNLGPQVVGKIVKKYIPIVNNSPAAITFSLALTPMTAALQQPGVLGISPTHPITLEGKGGTCKVEVLFKPVGRIPQFMEEVCTCIIWITLIDYAEC